MKPPDTVLRELVLQWLSKAAADFGAAAELSAQGGRFREIVAFHCQQAAEKYLKALLVRTTSPFGVEVRYPGDAPEIPPGGEIEAIDVARRLREAVLNSLGPYLDASAPQ